MKILVTGYGGSGKSTVCMALQQLGSKAIDTDTAKGLARWEHLDKTPAKVDYSKPIDYSMVQFNWNESLLLQTINRCSIIFGSASNMKQFFHLFDKVIVLSMPPGVQRKRLINRDSSYGKDSQTIDWILRAQQKLESNPETIKVDATYSPSDIAKKILME